MTLNEESASKGLKDNANFQLKNVVLHQEKKIASKHTKRDLWVVVCSQCPINYSDDMHTCAYFTIYAAITFGILQRVIDQLR